MKKINLFIILLLSIIFPTNVFAANQIDNIAIEVYLDQNGTAEITETWHVDGDDGTEWYKAINTLGNMQLSDYTVSMDGQPLTYKTWDIDESLSKKAGYYGINYTDSGLELCFGKYDYQPHTFTLNYKISNFVFNTTDAQVIYFKFLEPTSNIKFDNFQLNISAYYQFPDTLEVWGYGYKGYAYVSNGIIGMSNEETTNMNDKYAVLLAKFPLNTFTLVNSYSEYETFDDVYNAAESGSYEYDYDDGSSFLDIIGTMLEFFIFATIFSVGYNHTLKSERYGYIGNKQITKENTPMFRDIPCNKDIYYANTLIYLNKFNYQPTNIMGQLF